MKLSKRIGFIAVLILLVLGSVWANGASEKSTGNSVSKDEEVQLMYWSHYGQSPAFVQAFADSVNLAAKNLGYTNVTCKAEVIEYSNYEAKYITGFASNNGPDFFLARPGDWALDGGKNPIALPLDEKAAKAWDDALSSVFFNDGYFNGVRYGFPSEGGSIQMLYINTDAMKDAGLDPENDLPETLNELKTLAEKLTIRDSSGKIIRSGFQPRYLNGGGNIMGKFLPYFHNMGCRVLSEDLTTSTGYINGDEAVRAVSWFLDMVEKSSNLEFGSPETAFQSGQTAIINREGWFAKDTLDKAPNINFVCVPFPSDEFDLAPRSGGASWCNMVSAKTEYKDLCMEIMAELAKPEYDVTLHESAGYPPVLTATMTMENEYFGSMPYAEAVLVMSDKKPSPTYDAISSWSSISNMSGDTLATIFTGEAEVEPALDSLAVRIDQMLEQSK